MGGNLSHQIFYTCPSNLQVKSPSNLQVKKVQSKMKALFSRQHFSLLYKSMGTFGWHGNQSPIS